MQVGFKFFDIEAWSFYGTINAAVALILFIIARQKLDLQTLVFISLIGMLTGDLLPRILFIGFLCILLFQSSKSLTTWMTKTTLYVLATIIAFFIKYNNPFHLAIMSCDLMQMVLRIIITLWMVYIFYLMYLHMNKIRK